MKLIATHPVEALGGRYEVEIFDRGIAAYRVKRYRNTTRTYRQWLREDGETFAAVIRALVRTAAPGTDLREHLAACDCPLIRAAMEGMHA